MNILQIEYFLNVAESQHMTRSAENLHIAQPALTKMIHRLEEELGVPLFLPKGRNIVLSEYGRYLQKRLTPIRDELLAIPRELKTMAQLENRTIHLNVLAASSMVTEAVIEYNRRNENVSFEITQNTENELYDIGVTTRLLYQIPREGAGDEAVLSEKIFLAVPASHPLAANDRVCLKDAAAEGFISLMGSRQFRWICDRFCYHAGFTPEIIFESDNPTTVKNMIAAKMGVGFWPQFTWGRLESDGVKLLDITEPVCRRDILFHYRNNKLDNNGTEAFFTFLTSYCADKMTV